MSAVINPAAKTHMRSPRIEATPASASNAEKPLPKISGRASPITQPILFKGNSPLAAFVLSLSSVSPAAISSLTLYGVAQLFGVQFTESFTTLIVLITVLSILTLQSSRYPTAELLVPRSSLALALLLRWIGMILLLGLISYVSGLLHLYRDLYPSWLIVSWVVITPALVVATTLLLHELARHLLCKPQNRRTAVFVGCNETSASLASRFSKHGELCLQVAGFFDDRSIHRIDCPSNMPLLGSLSQLPVFVKEHNVDVIFIALPMKHIRRVHKVVDALGDTTASLYYVPDILTSDLFEARAGEIFGVPVIALRESPFHGYRGALKRMLDVIMSASALVAISPLLLAIAMAIKCTSHGPIIFKQRRYGLDGRQITIYKFRTMKVAEDGAWMAQVKRDDDRLIPIGRFLRRWSMDELPQLLNVLQGRMSLVGPRPHAVAHNEEYRRLVRGYMVRHKVPPGLTGLAQVHGYRGATPRLQDMQARIHYDLQYVHHWSLWLDLKIILWTIPKLIRTDRAF